MTSAFHPMADIHRQSQPRPCANVRVATGEANICVAVPSTNAYGRPDRSQRHRILPSPGSDAAVAKPGCAYFGIAGSYSVCSLWSAALLIAFVTQNGSLILST